MLFLTVNDERCMRNRFSVKKFLFVLLLGDPPGSSLDNGSARRRFRMSLIVQSLETVDKFNCDSPKHESFTC